MNAADPDLPRPDDPTGDDDPDAPGTYVDDPDGPVAEPNEPG